MLWWLKNAPLPIHLVTRGDSGDKVPGGLGQPNTRVLLGTTGRDFGSFSGMRFMLGGWLSEEKLIGIEGGGFLLERRSNRAYFTSDNSGNPLLALSFFNETPGARGESAHIISNAAVNKAGNVLVASSIQLWGAEVNNVLCMWREPQCEFNLLTGFRYMDLHERFRILKNTLDIAAPPTPSTVTTTDDNFRTRNQFYGGQLGGRVSGQWNRLTVDVTGKVALGALHQVVDIQGSSSRVAPAGTTLGSGGLYAQPSNIGIRSANPFTVIPSAEMKVGYQLTPRLQGFVGYDFLNWYRVVRPGDQIDRNINLSQSTLFGTNNGVLTGPARPAAGFDRSEFTAHGVNFGVEFRY